MLDQGLSEWPHFEGLFKWQEKLHLRERKAWVKSARNWPSWVSLAIINLIQDKKQQEVRWGHVYMYVYEYLCLYLCMFVLCMSV